MQAFALTSPAKPAALTELPDPEIPEDGVLIRVQAASVNGFDVYQASGGLMAVMPHDLPTVIGRDLAGVVVGIGATRTDVAVGDEVFGFLPSTPPLHTGTWAELVAGGADLILARKPATLGWAAAAAIPLAASTALDAVDAVDPRRGDTLLVMGATGGVGSFVVQFAAQRGARVIATAKPGEDDALVRSLGAAETVDYTQSGLGDKVRSFAPGGLTALIDVVSRGAAFTGLVALLGEGGRTATTLGSAHVEALAARGIQATNVRGTPTPEKLASLAAQAVAGKLEVTIQHAFPLADAADAIAAFNAGTRGKLVVTIA